MTVRRKIARNPGKGVRGGREDIPSGHPLGRVRISRTRTIGRNSEIHLG